MTSAEKVGVAVHHHCDTGSDVTRKVGIVKAKGQVTSARKVGVAVQVQCRKQGKCSYAKGCCRRLEIGMTSAGEMGVAIGKWAWFEVSRNAVNSAGKVGGA